MLQRDGGDLEIVDIKDMLVYCRLTGSLRRAAAAPARPCGCSSSGRLKEMVDERVRVIEV